MEERFTMQHKTAIPSTGSELSPG